MRNTAFAILILIGGISTLYSARIFAGPGDFTNTELAPTSTRLNDVICDKTDFWEWVKPISVLDEPFATCTLQVQTSTGDIEVKIHHANWIDESSFPYPEIFSTNQACKTASMAIDKKRSSASPEK